MHLFVGEILKQPLNVWIGGVDFLVKEGMVDNMILKIKVEAIK